MGCRGDKQGNFSTYEEIVDDYRKRFAPDINKEREFYGSLNLDSAIANAGRAKTPEGKRHPHQCRLKKKTLEEVTRKLKEKAGSIKECESFESLHRLLQQWIGQIKGVAELMLYDTALRLGFYLELLPEEVYLHAGTREGAKNLKLRYTRDTLPLSDFSGELQVFQPLKPYELEDCLCIYREDLKRIHDDNSYKLLRFKLTLPESCNTDWGRAHRQG